MENIRFTEKTMGRENILNTRKELENKNFMRRKIVAKVDLPIGSKINNFNICI